MGGSQTAQGGTGGQAVQGVRQCRGVRQHGGGQIVREIQQTKTVLQTEQIEDMHEKELQADYFSDIQDISVLQFGGDQQLYTFKEITDSW